MADGGECSRMSTSRRGSEESEERAGKRRRRRTSSESDGDEGGRKMMRKNEDKPLKKKSKSRSMSPEMKQGTLLEAIQEQKKLMNMEKNGDGKDEDVSTSKKKKKKRKKQRKDDDNDNKKEAEKKKLTKEVPLTGHAAEPGAIAGGATEEVDLRLTEEDFNENFESDEEEEARERLIAVEAQKVRRVEEKTIVFTEGINMDHQTVLDRFLTDVRKDIGDKKAAQPSPPPVVTPSAHTTCKCGRDLSDSSSSSSSDSENNSDENEDMSIEERARKKRAALRRKSRRKKAARDEAAALQTKLEIDWRRNHPAALSPEICFNVPGMLNEAPQCRCAPHAKSEGITHNYYMGEKKLETTMDSCGVTRLHHYILRVDGGQGGMKRRSSIRMKTKGSMGNHGERPGSPSNYIDFFFEGFSLLCHRPLPTVFPAEPQTKWTDEYRFELMEDTVPVEAISSLRALDAYTDYLLEDVLELYDVRRWSEDVESQRRDRRSRGDPYRSEVEDGCPLFHIMPRYVTNGNDGVKLLAPISAVLDHLRNVYVLPFCSDADMRRINADLGAFGLFANTEVDQLVINPRRRPCTVRIDSIDRSEYIKSGIPDGRPVITHYAIRPTNFLLQYRPDYQAALALLNKLKAELREPTDTSISDKERRARVGAQEHVVQRLRTECVARREYRASFASRHFRRTGFQTDVTLHALMLTVAMNHVRFHWAVEHLEKRISYQFGDRTLIESALSHPSYTVNYGTNADHARNTINQCGSRSYKKTLFPSDRVGGGKLAQEMNDLKKGRNRKKGLDRLVEIMEQVPGAKKSQISVSRMNERLEFLGDAIVEMIVTVHLFFLLPDQDEGALATFRSSLVQNKNLAALAKEICLDKCVLFSHGTDLIHEAEYRHAIANSFEAFMAAVYLDAKCIDNCERIYGEAMFGKEPNILNIWTNLKDHELKSDYPGTDRFLIPKAEALQKLVELEDNIGIKFDHIRVLARAMTRSSSTKNNLTKGDNQSLELLGDTILQLITTEFLYKRFPLLHEGHLSQLRTCLVSNKTQSFVCDDLQMTKYVINPSYRPRKNHVYKIKDKADLVESLLGAIYVDQGWSYCKAFCKICFFPRLKFFIDSHAWSDPKSALQQLCLALPRAVSETGKLEHRTMPDYRIVAVHGPTNTREYRVACHFRGKKISEGVANTVHYAQMKAAMEGMTNLPKMFPEEWAKHEQRLARSKNGVGSKNTQAEITAYINQSNRGQYGPSLSFHRNGSTTMNGRNGRHHNNGHRSRPDSVASPASLTCPMQQQPLLQYTVPNASGINNMYGFNQFNMANQYSQYPTVYPPHQSSLIYSNGYAPPPAGSALMPLLGSLPIPPPPLQPSSSSTMTSSQIPRPPARSLMDLSFDDLWSQ